MLEAVNAAPHCGSGRIKAAAALRAAVDQVDWNWEPAQQLLAIAAELRGTDTP